jgi:Transport protein particle (TRAPP) component
LERRLESTGFAVGLRVLELLAVRSKEYKRETKLMNLLQFISTTVWKNLFGKPADSLERSIDHADEFMIIDYAPITRYVPCTVYCVVIINHHLDIHHCCHVTSSLLAAGT